MSANRQISCRTLTVVGLAAIVVVALAMIALLGWFLPMRERAATETPAAAILAADGPPAVASGPLPVVLDPTPPPYWDRVYVEYILDASGSMLEDMDGQRKIDIAKEVLVDKAGQLPVTTNVGLRVFGHRIHYSDTEASCQDIELLVPPVRGGRDRVLEKLPGLEAQGMTPLSDAVIQSMDDFDHKDSFRHNSLVVISDGEETCGGDPCTMADDLVNVYSINFTMYVIGFDIQDNPTAQAQLRCLAERTDGVYVEANDRDELAQALDGMWNTLDERAAVELADQPSISGTDTPRPPSSQEPQGPTEDKIAFFSFRDEGLATYAVNADGSSLARLSDYGAPIIAWSPDGRRVMQVEISQFDKQLQLILTNSDGSNPAYVSEHLMLSSESWPTWSPDSQKLAFVTDDGTLCVIKSDGTDQCLTDNRVAEEYNNNNPQWSPDGESILFAGYDDAILLINADGSNLRRLFQVPDTNPNSAALWHPSWSPDGMKVLFRSSSDIRESGVYVINADGTGFSQVANDPYDDAPPSWSPDGKYIAYSSYVNDNADISIIDTATGAISNLTNDPADDLYPVWSPDGKQIAFTSGRTGNSDVFVMNNDGTGLVNVSNHPADDEMPIWLPRTVTQTKSLSSDSPLASSSAQHVAPTVTSPKPTVQSIPRFSEDEVILDLKPGVSLTLVRVPAGAFSLGSDDTDTDAFDTEKPQHEVYLEEYFIGKYEVTVAQFLAFVEATGFEVNPLADLSPSTPDFPVDGLTWDEAMAFCEWASEVTGIDIRLPTEAEWEKAARGTDNRLYPWGNTPPNPSLCNYADDDIDELTVVGSYSPQGDSPYGCADMAGNAEEWTSSVRSAYPYSPDDGREDVLSRGGRSIRGGNYLTFSRYIRSAYRHIQTVFRPSGGFRVAVSSPSS